MGQSSGSGVGGRGRVGQIPGRGSVRGRALVVHQARVVYLLRLQLLWPYQVLMVGEEARDERVDPARHHDVRGQARPLDAPQLGECTRACAPRNADVRVRVRVGVRVRVRVRVALHATQPALRATQSAIECHSPTPSLPPPLCLTASAFMPPPSPPGPATPPHQVNQGA